ncbi:Hypothetical predicted protein [Pelobates cultripes]|uniref:Uncharacterized protein n=1 Tax=Pelobates cultripes TaxID=61616 RepID=A0AAD1W160_PELCU|nr:Hypothetical predicted protein [Pelobates cultripes]
MKSKVERAAGTRAGDTWPIENGGGVLAATQLEAAKQSSDCGTDLMQRLDALFNDFWEKLQRRAQRTKTKRQDPMDPREGSYGRPGERGTPSGATRDQKLTLTHPGPPGLQAKRALTRRRRPHRRKHKRQSTYRPPATPMRRRHSGNVCHRVSGQKTQACTPAWGKRDTPTTGRASAPPLDQPESLSRIPTEGIG